MALTDYEIEEAIETNTFDKEKVLEQKEGFAVIKIDGVVQVMSGVELASLKKSLKKEDYSNISEVRGNMSFKSNHLSSNGS